ncbi:MAG: FAD binding domain-containing protein [Candidatus Fermentibacteraceae bacterium]|nr:FAD binding domain-containing protein [Candidatus Fermentibacteraceae bacterium]MBN2608450.1 FAD binding domain-containing protein [Candidatus Fermentibacteraceae bacterium]
MISFILNDSDYTTSLPPGASTLDLLRGEALLTGTREGCREGDCGACTVLLGIPVDTGTEYMALNSCILPVAELQGRHLVTIEGITPEQGLSAVQEAFVDEGASQCGFCTPGMVMSITGYLLSTQSPDLEAAIDSLGGNICRCTGYVSVRSAAGEIVGRTGPSPAVDPASARHLEFLVEKNVIPGYFLGIRDRLRSMRGPGTGDGHGTGIPVAGGTDLFAAGGPGLRDSTMEFLLNDSSLGGIETADGWVRLGAAVTVSRLISSGVFRGMGDLQGSLRLVSSTQVRNRATIGGNIVNASPIGDLAIILLALRAYIETGRGPGGSRRLALRDLYLGYKELDLRKGEIISAVSFPAHEPSRGYSFEKVSMRRHLDIASVNSAAAILVSEGTIREADISAGGVAPVPLYLSDTSAMLAGMPVTADTVQSAAESAMGEASPIDDVRGSARYKRVLLGRLVKSHFLKLFPGILDPAALL